MKLSNLNKRMPVVAALLIAGLFFNSCDNVDYSGKSSSNSETGTTSAFNTDNTVTDSLGLNNYATDTLSSYSTSTGRKGRRTGRVAVASAVPVERSKTAKMTTDVAGYYNYAEVAPSFSGGQAAIETYILNNLQYPEEAIDNDIEGTVNVQIGIDANGNVTSVKTIGNKLGYGLEEEAIKVVSAMPKWTAGTVKGKKVKTSMILPITYRLEE